MRQRTNLNGREVSYEIEFGREVENTHIGIATYTDTGTELDEGEIEQLTQLEGSTLDQMYYERQQEAAEHAADLECGK